MEEGAQTSRGWNNLPINDKIWAMPHTMPELHKMQENLDSRLSCLGAAY